MIRGMYSAATALVAASEQQEVSAYNLAHSSTPGYRERGVVYETFDRVLGRTLEPTGDITGTRVAGTYNDFRPGAVRETGNKNDLAIGEPDRFFVLAGPNGPLYTRNGTFYLSPQGQLLSQGGYALQGENGPIIIPPGTTRYNIASDGSVTADGDPAGEVRLVRFANLQQLTAAAPTLYTASPAAGLTPAPGRVMQGYLEMSNVQPADTMVRMIISSRYFDAAQRALRSMSESLQLNTRPTGS